MGELLEAIRRDNLVAMSRILEQGSIDIHSDVIIGEEYELEEHDEIPLLHYAIQHDASLDAVEMLLSHGIDITELNSDGLGVLDIAIKHKRLDIIHLCEANGVDLVQSRRKSGLTPLMLASSFGDLDMVKFLLSKGAHLDTTDRYGMSAIAYAKRMGHKRVLEFLEEQA